MKILLTAINAKYIHSNLAVYSLKASAGIYEDQVELAEYTINHQMDEIFAGIYRRKPELLLMSCYIWNRREVTETAASLKKVLPNLKIWAGGPEVTYDAEHFLRQNSAFDGVMIGEGEQTFYRLLDYYIGKNGTLEQIPGIAFRESARVRQEEAAGVSDVGEQETSGGSAFQSTLPLIPTRNLDHLPFVYQDLQKFENRILYYETSRGCPFSCSYCLSSVDKRVRYRSMELVKKELLYFLSRNVKQVKFVDRTFNCSHARTLELWRFLRDHDNGVTNFHCEISADLINAEEIEVLKTLRPGLLQLEIGVQTVNPDALRAIHRTAPFAEIAENVTQIAQAHNVHQHLDLIAGLPYEDFESFRTSFDAVYQLYPQELQLGFLKVLRGSEMYERAEEYGIVYRSTPPYEVLATKWITCDELLRLKEIEEMLEVYYNSLQYRNAIRAAQQLFTRPIELYEALADYYGQEGLNGKSWSRLQRLEILRRFLHAVDERTETGMPRFRGRSEEPADPACFDELLTLDLYLRENAKSRPDWAPDQNEEKDAVIEFYKKEEAAHHYLPELADRSWKQLMRMTHLEYFEHCRLAKVSPEVQAEPVKQSCGTEPMTGMKNRPGSDSSRTKRDGQWVLFCYEKRDVLTGDARVQVLPTDFCSVQLNRIKQHSVMTYLKDGPVCGKIK